MPTTGNTLGERRYFKYTDDGGEEYRYQTDETLGTAMGAELNDSLPDLPKRFKTRKVHMVATIAGEEVAKSVTAPTSDNTAYAANGPSNVVIDTVTFRTTGRTGEKRTWGANPVAAGP